MRVKREGLQVKIEPLPGITEKGLISSAGVYFQCPPLEEFSVDYTHSHTDYDTPRIGQMSRKGGRQLTTVTFDTLLVDWGLYTIIEDPMESEDFTDLLKKIVWSGEPFLLTAAHQMPLGGFQNWSLMKAGPELQMPATLRTLRVAEKAGEGDARYLNVAFTEYRDPLSGTRKLGKVKKRPKGGYDLPVTGTIQAHNGFFRFRIGKTDRVLKGKLTTDGDPAPYAVTLSDLAREFYGDPSQARVIAIANGLQDWGVNSNILHHPRFRHGGKIKVPAY